MHFIYSSKDYASFFILSFPTLRAGSSLSHLRTLHPLLGPYLSLRLPARSSFFSCLSSSSISRSLLVGASNFFFPAFLSSSFLSSSSYTLSFLYTLKLPTSSVVIDSWSHVFLFLVITTRAPLPCLIHLSPYLSWIRDFGTLKIDQADDQWTDCIVTTNHWSPPSLKTVFFFLHLLVGIEIRW